MKLKSILTTALLATTVLLAGRSAEAALNYAAGDLFLGFKGTGDAQDYLVNIGNVSQFSSLDGATFTVNVGGSIGADLATAFGSGWANRSDVFWGLIGTTYDGAVNLTPTLYATKPRSQTTPNVQSVPWKGRSNSGQVSSVSQIQQLAGYYKDQGNATGNSTKGTFQLATNSSSFAQLTATSNDFTVGGNIEGAFIVENGTANSVLDLYRIDPVFNQNATYLGKFTISNTGIVQFTAAAVPEPSTYGLVIGAGAVLLALKRRRRQSVNA